MPGHHSHRVTVVDSKTAKPIGVRHVRDDGSEQMLCDAYSCDESAEHDRVPEHSPESRAAHPELKPKVLLLLMLSILAIVLIAATAVAIIWNIAAGVLVLVFGTGLLFIGNPEVWATTERARERKSDSADSD